MFAPYIHTETALPLVWDYSGEKPAPLTKRMRRLLFQKRGNDCWVCCIAMMTGMDYNVIESIGTRTAFDYTYGLDFMRLVWTVKELGYDVRYFHPERLSPNKVGKATSDRARGRKAIFLLPSLNKAFPDAAHYVYVHDGVVYDPTPGTPYTDYEELEPLGVLFIEGY